MDLAELARSSLVCMNLRLPAGISLAEGPQIQHAVAEAEYIRRQRTVKLPSYSFHDREAQLHRTFAVP